MLNERTEIVSFYEGCLSPTYFHHAWVLTIQVTCWCSGSELWVEMKSVFRSPNSGFEWRPHFFPVQLLQKGKTAQFHQQLRIKISNNLDRTTKTIIMYVGRGKENFEACFKVSKLASF